MPGSHIAAPYAGASTVHPAARLVRGRLSRGLRRAGPGAPT